MRKIINKGTKRHCVFCENKIRRDEMFYRHKGKDCCVLCMHGLFKIGLDEACKL